MDSAFLLEQDARSNLLHLIAQSLGCSYICLWSYLAPTSCLCYLDGFYQEGAANGTIQPNRLFIEYRQSLFVVDQNSHSQVPGLAWRTNSPYIGLREEELSRLASNNSQRQFYQEARIKLAIFMGCRSGEIELGFSNIPQVDMETQMRALFPEDFARQIRTSELIQMARSDQVMNNHPSSSSSSLRSLSMDSPEGSSLFFSMPTTATTSSYINPELLSHFRDPQTITRPPPPITTSTVSTSPQDQELKAVQEFARSLGNIQFPIIPPECEQHALTRAYLAVLSSPSSSTASSHQQLLQQSQLSLERTRPTAFRRYSPSLPLRAQQIVKPNSQRRNILKRAISYCRSINLLRVRERLQGASRLASSTQLHHMMSERKRREKLNESFQALKSLLPPGTKKDKASVLATTREHLSSLKAQVEELRRKNAILEAQTLPTEEAKVFIGGESASSSTDRGSAVEVRARTVSESTSQDRTVDLQVIVRRDCSTLNLLIRILEFLKQTRNVTLVSMDADTRIQESNIVNRVSLRMTVEAGEWDEAAFQEAVRRVIADVAL